ncbi:RcnB family protein [Erythrobacter sp. WG]|uniref:RcnB family protein n=1 Tax=Erythrobacter sp. WG TaxID=2985510 RepID=UPI0022702D5B|nr:RcnB family protein [Erythrobacter sp. WG]MCX9148565.1 RcnB family protein [Erythrobacter sp. WG]
MMTLFAPSARRGASLAALAAMLALVSPALPAAAQEMLQVQPDEPAPPPLRAAPEERGGGPERAEMAPPASFEPPAPRFEQVVQQAPAFAPPQQPAYTPPSRIDPDIEAGAALAQRQRDDRRGRGGFGSGIRAQADAVRGDAPSPPRAERADRGARPDWRRGDGAWRGQGGWQGQRGAERAGQPGWQDQGARPDRQDAWQVQRRDTTSQRREDWRGRGVETRRDSSWGAGIRDAARQTGRDGWRDGRGDDWRNGRRSDWRGNDWRGNDWRDGRRDDWRRNDWRRADNRNWRRDDWRWGWNGRPGWDNRDFRRWDNRWRNNRSYNWFGWRNDNRLLFQPGPYFAPFRSHRYNRLSAGFFLDSLFFQPRFFINDPWAYRLPPAYGPYQWVRYYDDVLLVDIYTGEVVDVIYSFFW